MTLMAHADVPNILINQLTYSTGYSQPRLGCFSPCYNRVITQHLLPRRLKIPIVSFEIHGDLDVTFSHAVWRCGRQSDRNKYELGPAAKSKFAIPMATLIR
jgi:hypothetical protein